MDSAVENEVNELGMVEQVFRDAVIGLGWIMLNAVIFTLIYNNVLVPGYIDSYPISDMTSLMMGEEVIIEELANQLVIDDRGRILHEQSFLWGVLVGMVLWWSTNAAQSIRAFFGRIAEMGDQWRARNQEENEEVNEDVEPKSNVVLNSHSQ